MLCCGSTAWRTTACRTIRCCSTIRRWRTCGPLPLFRRYSDASGHATIGSNRFWKSGETMTAETDTIIVGAGPAGLAVGAVLRRANVPFVMLERAECVGASWHRHYDRLHLH